MGSGKWGGGGLGSGNGSKHEEGSVHTSGDGSLTQPAGKQSSFTTHTVARFTPMQIFGCPFWASGSAGVRVVISCSVTWK